MPDVVVAVDELVQVVRGLRVVLVNVFELVVSLSVYPDVQDPDDNVAQHDPSHDEKHVHLFRRALRLERSGYHVETDDARHDAARKGEQQADYAAGVPAQQRANHAAEARTAYAGYRRYDYYPAEVGHGCLPFKQ